MAPIYSRQLANNLYAGAIALDVYTVPPATVVVVTDIDVFLDNGAANLSSYVEVGACLLLYHTSAAAELTNQQWVGKQVLNPGQVVRFVASGLFNGIAVTGYVLGP